MLVLLAISCLGIVWVFWRVLQAGPLHAAPDMQYDTAGSIWTNAWVAHAIAHLQNPFFSPNLMHPFGINLLANAYNTAFSVVFTPITWLFSPVLSTNLQLMMDPVVNTVVMGLCLRRFVRSPWLAVAGGVAWGFCPFVVSSLAKGWTNVGFLVAPPLIAWLLAELCNERGWSPRRVGLGLAATIVVQYFVDSELLVITLIGAVVGVLALAVQERRRILVVRRRWAEAAVWAAVPVVLILLGPVLYGALGPHAAPSWVRPEADFQGFVSPLHGVLFTPRNPTPPPNLRFGFTANPQFLGLGAALVVVAGLALFRFPRVLRPLFVVGVFGLWVSVGYGPWWSPYELISHVPVLHNITLTRFIILTWFAAIVIVVDLAGRAASWCHARIRWRSSTVAVGLVVVLVAFTPPLEAVAQHLPISASSTTADDALAVVLAPPGRHVVMGYPFPVSVREMLQQAQQDNFSFDMPGGEYPQIFDSPEPSTTVNKLMQLAGQGQQLVAPTLHQVSDLQFWISRWGVTDVIVPRSFVLAYAAVYGSPQQFVAIVTEALGAPRVVDGEWVWSPIKVIPPAVTLTNEAWKTCTTPTVTPVAQTPACVERLGQINFLAN